MKNSYKIAIIFSLLIISNTFGQQKLKGNKTVTTEDRDITEFTAIEVIDNLNVILVYNQFQSVNVEADSNLQSSILTDIRNGKLTIRTSEAIGRHKTLDIHINVNNKIKEINAFNKAKITSKKPLAIDSLAINSFDDSEFDLKLNSEIVEIHGKEKSKLELEILAEVVKIKLNESCDLTATIDSKEVQITGSNDASATLEGTTNAFEIEFSEDSFFKGIDFIAKNGVVKANNNAKLYIHIADILDLYTNNSSEVHLYADPKITLHEFYDKSIIRKKEL